MDDSTKLGATLLGATVVGLFFLNRKVNKRTETLRDHTVRIEKILDAAFQADVDAIFAEIVNNYEE